MRKKIVLLTLYIGSLLAVICTPANGQILQDTASVGLLKKYIGYIYNFQFDKAEEVYIILKRDYPGDPALYVLNSVKIYWENYPLLTTSQACNAFEKELRDCIQQCERKQGTKNEVENLLINLCARGYLLLFYADNDLSVEVFPLAASTYQYVRKAFNYTSIYPDFYLFTGLYDYYREAYPEAHPVYAALSFLFPKGDKKKGLKNLIAASENSIFLKAESYNFLSWIYLSFENNFLQASNYSKSVSELFPENLAYRAEYIKNLLLVKKYDEAEKVINQSGAATGATNSYYQAQLTIFNGILQEKRYHNYDQAEKLYEKGARDIALFGDYANNFTAYCYFGLSRICDIKGDKQYKKIYRKLAMKLIDFKKINFDE